MLSGVNDRPLEGTWHPRDQPVEHIAVPVGLTVEGLLAAVVVGPGGGIPIIILLLFLSFSPELVLSQACLLELYGIRRQVVEKTPLLSHLIVAVTVAWATRVACGASSWKPIPPGSAGVLAKV